MANIKIGSAMTNKQKFDLKKTKSNNRTKRYVAKQTTTTGKQIARSAAEAATAISTNKMLADREKAKYNAQIGREAVKSGISVKQFNDLVNGNPQQDGVSQDGNTPNFGHGGGVD